MTTQAFTMPITMLPALPVTRPDGHEMYQHYERQEQPRNGIVYIGEEMGRTKRMYKSSGFPARQVNVSGRLVDIYV